MKKVASSKTRKPADGLETVRAGLQFYVGRNALLDFKEVKAPGGKAAFQFRWFYDHPMEILVDPKAGKLEFRHLFPNLTAKSEVFQVVGEYLASLHSPKRPENERINRRKAECECVIRGGGGTLIWTVKGNQYDYAVHRLIDVVHDLFLEIRDNQFAYVLENFNVPED